MGSTYNEQAVENVLRTEMDAGPVKSRRRFTAVPTNIEFTLPWLSRSEYAALQAWFKNDLLDGSLSFTADHPVTGESGSFRFRTPFRASVVGAKVIVRLSLELLP